MVLNFKERDQFDEFFEENIKNKELKEKFE